MNEQPRRPLGPQSWDVVRNKLDQSLPFANMRDTPYYRDAIYEQFSPAEYARRYAALRAKMRADKLDVVIVPGPQSRATISVSSSSQSAVCLLIGSVKPPSTNDLVVRSNSRTVSASVPPSERLTRQRR